MAMATSASAGSIVFASGPVSPNKIESAASVGQLTSSIALIKLHKATGGNLGITFDIFAEQNDLGGRLFGQAGLTGNLNFVGSGLVKKLSSGAVISAGDHFARGSAIATESFSLGRNEVKHKGWTAGKTGFAGFSFSTALRQRDYGWVKLVYSVGANGAVDEITAESWAYNSTPGAPITAGEAVITATPEPSTYAVLGLGALGLLVRRKKRS